MQAKKQSIVPLLNHLTEQFGAAAEKKGIIFKVEMPKPLPVVNIDEEKMGIALSNISDNAVKYSFPGKIVELKVKTDKREMTISVTDEGIGIPQAEQFRIFSKFFRSSQALLHHTSGTGLGLYLAKNIVEQHGGKIWFDSVENKGTTFHVSLPLI